MITNGMPILASDLNTAFRQFTGRLRIENRRTGGSSQQPIPEFKNINSSTLLVQRTFTFVSSDDVVIENLGCNGVNADGYTVTVTVDGAMLEPVVLSGTMTAGTIANRYRQPNVTPHQILLKGATYTVVVASSGSGICTLRPWLLLQHSIRKQ